MLNTARNFGAVGDEPTGDRRVQAATDGAASNRKGGMLFPAGAYRVSGLNFPSGRFSSLLSNSSQPHLNETLNFSLSEEKHVITRKIRSSIIRFV